MSHVAAFAGGLILGLLLTMGWVFILMREDRRSNEALAHDECTPEWCPLIVNRDEMAEEEITAMPMCSHPHDDAN